MLETKTQHFAGFSRGIQEKTANCSQKYHMNLLNLKHAPAEAPELSMKEDSV